MARACSRIEAEQRNDRLFRRLTIVGWSATGLVVLLLVAFGIMQVRAAMQFVGGGAAGFGMAIGGLVPVGVLCALAATLATIGLFIRMRSASMHEIQLRFAALEDLLTQADPKDAPDPRSEPRQGILTFLLPSLAGVSRGRLD